jgi:hypothetical protein
MRDEKPASIRIRPHRNLWLDPAREEIMVLVTAGPLAVALVVLSLTSAYWS